MTNELLSPPPPKQGGLIQAEEQRAVQEVQAALVIAKRFPRDQKAAVDRIMNTCTRESLAAVALYQYARGGTDISGASIRLAEAIAQNWGNLDFGFRELSRGESNGKTYSEVQAYAWDMETNTRRSLQFRVTHWRDTRKGGYAVTDERDIYELLANQSQRRVRACILAIVPGDVVEQAEKQCLATLNSKADTSPEATKKLVEAFAEIGVTKEQIEARIQRRLDAITPAQVVNLRKVYTSIKDGMSEPGEWFESQDEAAAPAEVDVFAKEKQEGEVKRSETAKPTKPDEDAEQKGDLPL